MKGENARFLLGVTLVTEKEKHYCHKYKLQKHWAPAFLKSTTRACTGFSIQEEFKHQQLSRLKVFSAGGVAYFPKIYPRFSNLRSIFKLLWNNTISFSSTLSRTSSQQGIFKHPWILTSTWSSRAFSGLSGKARTLDKKVFVEVVYQLKNDTRCSNVPVE